jgi:hypothetical protein
VHLFSHSCSHVLFLIYNRPALAQRVFARIREAHPTRLFVAADGPRNEKPFDAELCKQARKVIDAVDWDCEVMMLFRENNLGCKKAVGSAIDWFFTHVERGIILEDDCLPHPDFFSYCDSLLDYYETDERVSVIAGDNFQDGRKRGTATYYFSKYNHCWGWATWRRAWQFYRGDLPFWQQWNSSDEWLQTIPDRVERNYWSSIFEKVRRNEIDSWAYPWTASVWYHGGLTATPNVNLVTNIGFGPDATHTVTAESEEGLPVHALGPLIHPERIEQEKKADRYVFDHHFGGLEHRLHWRVLQLLKRITRKIVRTMSG